MRRWTSWHRFVTLAMVALAYLVLLTASATPTPLTRPANPSAPEPGLPDLRHPVSLTIAEPRHLIAHLIIKAVVDAVHLLSWSAWRRRHQATARRCHHRHRHRLTSRSDKCSYRTSVVSGKFVDGVVRGNAVCERRRWDCGMGIVSG